jgi:dihydrolipoamide dehydrogenase
MLAHKAVHEALVAAEVIAGELQGNKELAATVFNARAIANSRDEGLTKLLFDDSPEEGSDGHTGGATARSWAAAGSEHAPGT